MPEPQVSLSSGRAVLIVQVITYSSEKKNIFKLILMGITAKKTSNHRINLMTHLNRLISFECLASNSVGYRFVQNYYVRNC